MTESIVTYRTGVYKALFLPVTGAEECFCDLMAYGTSRLGEPVAHVRLWRDADVLHLEVRCLDDEPGKVDARCRTDGMGVWAGDLLEIFFGSMEGGTPWQRQCCIAAGGGRFDSCGRYGEWCAKAGTDGSGWHAEADFPYGMFDLRQGRLSFNICRQVPRLGAYTTYSDVKYGFDELSNHCDLFFCDCVTAWMLLGGGMAPAGLSRENFRRMVEECSVPAGRITDAPVLINPSPTQMSVVWRTAGICAGALEYRQAGKEQWRRIVADIRDGVAAQDSRLHRVDLMGLAPATRYEYRVISLHYVLEERSLVFPEDGALSFTTFSDTPHSFSCGIFSDLHSQRPLLDNWLAMEEFSRCEFNIQLGDLLAALVCTDSIFGDILTAFTEGCPGKPLAMVRGNHDQERFFAMDYSRFNSQEGRTYGMFNCGDVCFLYLDTGNDHIHDTLDIRQTEALTDEQEAWLRQILTASQWTGAAYRVALLHIPPNIREGYGITPAMRLANCLSGAAVRPDIMLCGHQHAFAEMLPGQSPRYPGNTAPFLSDGLALPFPLFVNSNNTAIILKFSAGQMELRAFDENGRVIEIFRAP